MHKATLYETNNSMQQVDSANFLSQFIDKFTWKPNEIALDVGCGPGDITAKLLLPKLGSNVVKLVGMDVSPNMIKHAINHHKNPKLEFVLASITDQHIDKLFLSKFNKIFSFYCLHWVQDQRQAFLNIFNLLAPGGQVLLLLNTYHPINTLYEIISRKQKWAKYTEDYAQFVSPYHHSKNPESEMRSLLEQIGFKIEHCDVVKQTFSYQSISSLRHALAAVNPFLERMSGELQGEFLDELVNMSFNGNLPEVFPGIDNSTITFNYYHIRVFAKK